MNNFLEGFIYGYAAAACWTGIVVDNDDATEYLTDVLDTEALDELVDRIVADPRVIADCVDFVTESYKDMQGVIETGECPSWDHHGHDFLLTRDGHGAGFWDRGYGEVGNTLTEAASGYGGESFQFWIDDHGNVDYDYS